MTHRHGRRLAAVTIGTALAGGLPLLVTPPAHAAAVTTASSAGFLPGDPVRLFRFYPTDPVRTFRFSPGDPIRPFRFLPTDPISPFLFRDFFGGNGGSGGSGGGGNGGGSGGIH